MEDCDDIIVRKAQTGDLPELRTFFIKAYGNLTIFQDENFLLYYFDSHQPNVAPFNYSLIAVNLAGEIVSHYGGIQSKFKLNDSVISIIWGVNAYTLPEWRNRGINSKIVNYIQHNNPANATMGMQFDTLLFYKKLGYKTFNNDTLKRFVYVLNSDVSEIMVLMGHNPETAKKMLRINEHHTPRPANGNIVHLTAENFESFDYNLIANVVATTHRDVDFLSWRLFRNPYIKYQVYGLLQNKKIVSYIAIRQETLEPTSHKVNRIIDLFGDEQGIVDLLHHTTSLSKSEGCIYIDFSMYGKLYENELLNFGFDKLEGNDVCILPMVCSPIENRPNNEFIALQSNEHNEEIRQLTFENVYITRIDGDRDRIARITK